MTIFQIFAVLFALFMLYVVSIHFRKKTLDFITASFWACIWVVFMVIAVFPNLLLGITGVLKFSRVFDLLIVIAFMILSVMVFLSYFRLKELEHKLEKYVREEAIKSAKTKK